MSEPLIEDGALPDAPVARALTHLARVLAYVGGVVLIALTLLSSYSILMRTLFDEPLLGDVELVQMGCGIAIVLFLPLCQLNRGNVIVDVFTLNAPAAVRAWLDAIGGLLVALSAALLAWRSGIGVMDAIATGEESTIMGLPLWWSMSAFPVGFACLTLTALYTAWQDLNKERG